MSTNGWQIALVQLEFCKVTHDWPFLDSWFYICGFPGIVPGNSKQIRKGPVNFFACYCSSWGRKLKECWELLRLDLFGSSSGASLCPWLDLHISVLKPYGQIFTLVSRISSFLQTTHAGKMPRVVQPRPLGEKMFPKHKLLEWAFVCVFSRLQLFTSSTVIVRLNLMQLQDIWNKQEASDNLWPCCEEMFLFYCVVSFFARGKKPCTLSQFMCDGVPDAHWARKM